MKKLLIATTNPGKLEEITLFLKDLPVALVSLKDSTIKEKPEENGKTFEKNAILKAKFYAEKSGLPTIADDGGLEIDALDGEPGVKSHRWIHGEKDNEDEELIEYALKRLKNIPLPKRGAQLHAVLAFALPNGKVYTSEGLIRGTIPMKASSSRTKGFPYRSLLYLPQIFKFYNTDDLTTEENDAYNHRKRALEELKPILQKYLNS